MGETLNASVRGQGGPNFEKPVPNPSCGSASVNTRFLRFMVNPEETVALHLEDTGTRKDYHPPVLVFEGEGGDRTVSR